MRNLQKCILHAGVHKTGTTQIQMFLHKNRRRLQKNGIAFMKYNDLHEDFTKAFVYKSLIEEGRAWLGERLGDSRVAILSNEDFMGGYPDYRDGIQYPDYLRNMRNLIEMLPDSVEIDVLLSVRSYGDWIESCYLQFLKTRPKKFVTFDEYIERIDIPSMNWNKMVAQLQLLERVARVHFFAYEDFRVNNEPVYRYLEKLINLKLERLPEGTETNSSFSALAYRLIQVADSEGMRMEDRVEFRKYLRAHFTVSHGYERPELFPAYVKHLLAKAYVSDLSAIRSQATGKLNFVDFASVDEAAA